MCHSNPKESVRTSSRLPLQLGTASVTPLPDVYSLPGACVALSLLLADDVKLLASRYNQLLLWDLNSGAHNSLIIIMILRCDIESYHDISPYLFCLTMKSLQAMPCIRWYHTRRNTLHWLHVGRLTHFRHTLLLHRPQHRSRSATSDLYVPIISSSSIILC